MRVNDCFRLLENYELIFNELLKAAEEEEEQVKKQLLDMLAIHQRIFAAVAALVPSFRSTKRLSPLQQNKLLENIKKFWNAYMAGPGSVTTKIHMLVFHTRKLLETYGTVGFWAEDSFESIHAIVNTLARQNAALDRKRRAVQVLRGLEGRKQRKTAEMEAKAKKQDGSTLSRKLSRTQGRLQDSSELVTVEPNQDIVDAADELSSSLKRPELAKAAIARTGILGQYSPR